MTQSNLSRAGESHVVAAFCGCITDSHLGGNKLGKTWESEENQFRVKETGKCFVQLD